MEEDLGDFEDLDFQREQEYSKNYYFLERFGDPFNQI